MPVVPAAPIARSNQCEHVQDFPAGVTTRYESFALRRPIGASATLLVDRRHQLKTQELSRRLRRALTQSGCCELRSIRVDVDANRIRLRGRVSRFYHKQLAQEAVRSHAGHRRIINQILVD